MYLSPLSDASAALGQSGLIATMSGCRPFIPSSESTSYGLSKNCVAFNRDVYSYIEAHPKIHTVALGLFWNDSDEKVNSTAELAHTLIAKGRKVLLIGPIPLPGMDVQIDWAMQQIRAGHPIDEILVSRTSEPWMQSLAIKLQHVFGRDMELGNLYVLDPNEQLCENDNCFVVRNGIANFCDTSHITEVAARNMKPIFQAAFKQFH
jgi:hypothetical protein